MKIVRLRRQIKVTAIDKTDENEKNNQRSNVAMSGRAGLVRMLLAIFIVAFVSMSWYQVAQAAGPYFNRKKGDRYYEGVPTTEAYGRFMFEDGLPRDWSTAPTTVDSFVNEVKYYLNSPLDIDRARASVLVNTMMGLDGDDPSYNGPSPIRWQNGVTVAQSLLPRWEAVVRAYDARSIAGASVEWNASVFVPDRTINGYGDGGTAGPGNQYPDVFFGEVSSSVEATIVFHNPGGSSYNIKKKCGNLTGDHTPLFQGGDFEYAPSLQPDPSSPAFGSTVQSDKPSVTLDGFVRNAGLSDGQAGTYWVVPSLPVGAGNFLVSQSSATASAPRPVPVLSPGANQQVAPNIVFTFDWTKPRPAQVCFVAYVSPRNSSDNGPVQSASYCYIIGSGIPPTTANRPFFTVNSGDVSAGSGMSIGGNECTAAGGLNNNQDASIVSWNLGAAGSYGGAGTQFGALALNHLQGFATGQGSGLAPSGAAFANTGGSGDQIDPGRELYGGEFGAVNCTADFFEHANSVQTGNITVAGRAIANGTRQTIYVDGNVYITGNITFSGNYANTAEIPAFSIVVRGNIYIAPGVTQLDGFYIAQPTDPSATNGIIYSCAPAPFTSASLNRNLHASCNTALTVNGAFVARQVWLLRTAGTLTTTPAETFNYVPEAWLSAPFGNGLDPGIPGDYDAITSLPPVL